MLVCSKRFSTKTIVIPILKYLAKYFMIRTSIVFVIYVSGQTNANSKSAAETLKQEGEICEKLTVEVALLY